MIPATPEPASTDVLVDGAGPVGLALAVDLARRGVSVRVVDTLAQPTTESRAIVVHSRSLDHLDALGVADEVHALGRRADGNDFHADGRTFATVEFGGIRAVHPYSLNIAQTDTESVLTRRLAALGVPVERSTRLVSYEERDGVVVARATHDDGSDEAIRARYLVGADGARSTVRELMGQRLAGTFAGELFLIGDVEGTHPYNPSHFHTFFSPTQPSGLLFSLTGNRIRVFVQLPPDTDPAEPATVEWLQEALDERGIELRIHSAHWITRFEVKHGQVPQYRSGRVFLAGDAAHIHSPAGGLGMNTGIQDAMNLSWKLAWTLAHGDSPALLDSYHAERHPVAERVIAFTTRLSTMGTIHSEAGRRVRNTVMHLALDSPVLANRLAATVEQQDVRYRDSPVVGGSGRSLRPGDFLFLPGTVVARALATSCGHLAIVLPGAAASPLPDGMDSLLLSPSDAEHLARAAGLTRGGVVIVRPDGYVGHIGQDVPAAFGSYAQALAGGVPR